MTFFRFVGRKMRLAGAMVAMLSVSACVTATTPEEEAMLEETNDPLEPMNRYFFEVNRFIDEFFLKPVAWWYRIGVPDPVRNRIHNALTNLTLPWTVANDALQGEFSRAGVATTRFVVNSTLGVAGLFDVATDWGYPHHDEDLGQTLAVWGVPEGPYLVLPVLGPSNPRDAVGFAGAYFGDPVNIGLEAAASGATIARGAVSAADTRERNIETLADIERNAVDFYATVRSIYRQQRASEIRNGAPEEIPLPGLESD